MQGNILHLFQENNVDFGRNNKHGKEGWTQVKFCPYCDSTNYHLGLRLHGEPLFHCWKCGWHPTIETVARCCELDEIVVAKFLFTEKHYLQVEEYKRKQGRLQLPVGTGELKPIHLRYLEKRGFSKETAMKYGLKGVAFSDSPMKSWRVLIPYIYKGEIVSYTCRDVTGKSKMRYLSASAENESISKKSLLFGSQFTTNTVCVFEGEFDAIAFGEGGVATGGTSYTELQVKRISKYPLRGICFDNEPTAQQRASVLCKRLEAFEGKTVLIQLNSKDMATASNRERLAVRRALSL